MAREPLWRTIANDLRDKIESGELGPGTQLPNENDLRVVYDNASRNTIREATKWLSSRKLVSSQPGRGTFVVEQGKRTVISLTPNDEGLGGGEGSAYFATTRRQGGTPTTSRPKVEIQYATNEIARALRIDPGAEVVSRHQERYIDGGPNSLQTSYYSWALIDQGATALRMAADIDGGTTRYLKEVCDIEQVGYRDRLLVRQPNDEEVAFFDVPDDGTVSVIATLRTTYDPDGAPIRYTETIYAYDQCLFVIDYGKVPPLALGKPE